ncbi:MAG: prolipoprotein diacylglyceryl transferase [Chitinophagaceae bacterium]|nr:prolipoprotein diacylglyceryl transferase [Chitinophagaceae bacterium]
MYPNLYYAFKDLFGIDLPGLRFINSFGFFVAFAFLAAAYVLNRELRKKERAGLLVPEETKIIVGKPALASELALNFILGFLLGYKILGLFLSDHTLTADPQAFIFSASGHWPAGLLLGGLFAVIKWMEKNRQKLPAPEERIIRIWPHDRVGDMVIFAAVFGFLGAKIFHNLENWNEFWKNPVEALLSFSGLTFYGGLICAAVAIYFYAKKHKIGFRYLCDSIAPALLLAYAVGRIGCQVSGDGDWGILNSAYISTPEGKVVSADSTEFNQALQANSIVYMQQSDFKSISDIQHKHVQGPSWLPRWMIAYNFPHNVIGEGVKLQDCTGQYCNQLPIPVFPTAFYETVVCLILTGFLFLLRDKLPVPGTLFAVYLIFNGIERFLVEQIRVNTQYHLLGIKPTQAELISTLLIIAGIGLFIALRKNSRLPAAS